MYRVLQGGMLALTLISGCGASAQPPAAEPGSRPASALTRAAALRMTTAQLARLLLPGEATGRFVGHKVGEFGAHGEPISLVHFFHRPTPTGVNFCRRDVTNAYLQPEGVWEPGKDSPVRFAGSSAAVQIAVAPRCRLKPGALFALVQPKQDEELAVKGLRRLVALQAAAKAGRPLPKIECTSEFDAKDCDAPARTIAALPLYRLAIIEGRQKSLDFAVMPDAPDKPNWKITLPLEDSTEEPIVMSWGYPAPF